MKYKKEIMKLNCSQENDWNDVLVTGMHVCRIDQDINMIRNLSGFFNEYLQTFTLYFSFLT